MKNTNLPKFLLIAIVVSFSAAHAQNIPPADVQRPQFEQRQPKDERPNLMRELGLTREQKQQLHRLNIERKPLMQEAQRRLHEANRNLDMAIYADSVSDEEVEARLREFQEAQANVARLRFMNELNVRKILTAEQLVKFRELRRRFSERMRQNRQMSRPMNPQPKENMPFRRFRPQKPTP